MADMEELTMTCVFCPMFATVEEALTWFEERGITCPVPWRGPDGLVRGSGRK